MISLSCITALLLDVEGTTTPIDFVHRVLFSYARAHVEEYLRTHWENADVRADISTLHDACDYDAEKGLTPPAWSAISVAADQASALAYVNWLMDQDAKRTALKSLQGRIWQQGYEDGRLSADVFPDVRDAFLRWSRQARTISIFSSGSVLAQKLLFANTRSGDLSLFLHHYFDTTTGAKNDPGSYAKIAAALAVPVANVMFVSDTVQELDAAGAAGMQTTLCVRERCEPDRPSLHEITRTFDTILP